MQIMVCAGEPSGDRHAAGLVRALRRRLPEAKLWGMGGEHLERAGVDIKVRIGSISVVGITEVLGHLTEVWKARKVLLRHATLNRPSAAILVDYPEFHLWLARGLKRRGIPVFYYISPQIWAWRRGRVKTMKRVIDRVAVILPFEEGLLRDNGIQARYVGHPLLEQVKGCGSKEEAKRGLGIPEERVIVGLLPGSRPKEVQQMLPVMLEGVNLASQRIKGLLPLVAVSPLVDPSSLRHFIEDSPLEVMAITDCSYAVIEASDAVVVASGTATLETALLETPMVVVYKTSWLSYLVGRILVRVKNISLVNLLAGRTIVPELIQGGMKPANIAHCLEEILLDDQVRSRMREDLKGIQHMLGEGRASEYAAEWVMDLIAESNGLPPAG